MKVLELIKLYCYLCDCYTTQLQWHCQRFSPNSYPNNLKITDQELLCIYFYCRRFENKHKKSEIHDYALRYMGSYFPNLPNYGNFNARINRLEDAILAFVPIILEKITEENIVKNIIPKIALVDAFPIILCSGKRKGKVAPEISDKTFCATKGIWYYGVKMHTVANKVTKKLPLINFISITPASFNDLIAFKPILPQLVGYEIYADKAYSDLPLHQELIEKQNTCIYTPVKLVKGESDTIRQFNKAADDLYSVAVSTLRQPIEALFSWIQEKTGLQNASKVRAKSGLMVHIFGAIATSLFYHIL